MDTRKSVISIIFLDIDGVLTLNEEEDERILPILLERGHESTDSIPCLEYDQIILELFSQGAVNALEHLIMKAEAVLHHEIGIVLSSDWRINRKVPFLQKLFKRFSFASKIIDRTPQLKDAAREEEITYWLKARLDLPYSPPCSPFHHDLEEEADWKRYEIESFVILDDHDSAFSNHFPDQFVKVKALLNDSDCQKAIFSLQNNLRSSFQCMETINQFQAEKYEVCEEEYESLESLIESQT